MWKAYGFVGGGFDGRYLYTSPVEDAVGHYGIVMRDDTSATFTDNDSWSQFKVSSVFPTATSAAGAAFDGRFLYLPPKESTLVRYDTLAEFRTETSWSAFDLTTVNAKARSFSGALFDGRHVYLIPEINGLVLRFDATSSSAPPMLPAFSGSFF